MKRLLVLSMAFALSAPALAAPPTVVPAPQPRIFLSPSGEPFRAPPGGVDPVEAWFAEVDANHDGAIDRAEFRLDAARFFKRLDANGDGIIDGFETGAYEANVVPEYADEAEGRYLIAGPRRGRRSRDAAGGASARHGIERLFEEAEPVSGADFDFNSKITLAEWMKAPDERFDLLDTGQTGRLTREALRARLAGPVKPKR